MNNGEINSPERPIKVVGVKREGNVKYTYYSDGVVKITRYKRKKKVYWGRIIAAAIVFVLLIMGLCELIGSAAHALKNDGKRIESNGSVADSSASSSQDDASLAAQTSDSSQADDVPAAAYSDMDISVCIDAGHGSYDMGTVADDGTTESAQTLSLALKMKSYLESCGVTVYMTRETDRQVSISDRCSLANRNGADFYISLHRCSTAENANDRGTEIWVNNAKPAYDVKLAENIMSKLEYVGISNTLGVKYGYFNLPDQNFQVNTDTEMPSCLIELGYMTSDVDNNLFIEHESDYAKAISDAAIETAIELNVVDSSGKRTLGQQLISQEKQAENSDVDSEATQTDVDESEAETESEDYAADDYE